MITALNKLLFWRSNNVYLVWVWYEKAHQTELMGVFSSEKGARKAVKEGPGAWGLGSIGPHSMMLQEWRSNSPLPLKQRRSHTETINEKGAGSQ